MSQLISEQPRKVIAVIMSKPSKQYQTGLLKGIYTVDYWNKADGTESNHDYLLSIKCDTLEERLSRFEEATIFNGKTIYEVEKDITVLYG